MPWLTNTFDTLTLVAETSDIDNAKAPNIKNLHPLVADNRFCHEVRKFENSMKRWLLIFLSKRIVKGAGRELTYLFFVTYFLLVCCCCCCLFFLSLFFLLPPVSSKHFIKNLQLIWTKVISVSWSNPDIIVTIGLAVRITIRKVRISVVSGIVCNFHIMGPKSWKIVIVAVRGVLIVVCYVLFKISITVVVFQWV